jgi:hypothetical protein
MWHVEWCVDVKSMVCSILIDYMKVVTNQWKQKKKSVLVKHVAKGVIIDREKANV